MSTQTLIQRTSTIDIENNIMTPITFTNPEPAHQSAQAQYAAHMGLLVNFSMTILKAFGGWIFASESLLADAFHSATDIAADVVTLVTVLLSRGNSKSARTIESLGSLCVSGFIFTGGFGIAIHGFNGILPYFSRDNGGLGISAGDEGPDVTAAWVAIVSVLAKEWVYRLTMRIALEEKSPVLMSNAIHHRIDCLSSVVALVAIVGLWAFPGAEWLDPVGAMVISLMILQAGVEVIKEAMSEFMPGRKSE